MEISLKVDSISGARIVLVLILYCASGTLLTLFNKLAIVAFPHTNLLLALQNGMTLLLLILSSHLCRQKVGSLPKISLVIVQSWLPLVLLFVSMLTSSLLALAYVSVPTMIVMRNLTTLSVAVLEYVLLNNKINGFSATTLVFMILGAVLYAKHDLTFSILGYSWLVVNIVSTSAYQIYVKKIIHSPLFENIGSLGMSYYNNLISLPFLLIFACIIGELNGLASTFRMRYLLSSQSLLLVVVTGSLGFLLSISAFKLNKLISATSLMVANNANKFIVIILSEIFIQSTLGLTSSIGAVSVLYLGWLYSQSAKSSSKRLLWLTVIAFSVTIIAVEYKHMSISMIGTHRTAELDDTNGDYVVFSKLVNRRGMKNSANKLPYENETYKIYLPESKTLHVSRTYQVGISVKAVTTMSFPEICVNRNASIWKVCDPKDCKPYTGKLGLEYPQTTTFGEKTEEFIHRVLELAWGSNPPSIDLYLRSGCNGIMEMRYLFKSIELFWPRFLGSIIVVLDAGDESFLKYILPIKPTHNYVIKFEHVPCMPPRIFNQYSYLNADRHSSADYIVTVDSDCIFHSPVTPDLIFRQGKVILSSSKTFQGDWWLKPLESMLGVGMYDGHYMVTQPVTFARSTFSSFRQWFYISKGKCYEDQLSMLLPDNYGFFCWMCQLGTYLEKANPVHIEHGKYWFQHLDDKTLEPLLRFAIHVTYEPSDGERCENSECYAKLANSVIHQGLCRAFGSSVFHFCANSISLDYINNVTFLYAHTDIQAAGKESRVTALANYLSRLSQVTQLVLKTYA